MAGPAPSPRPGQALPALVALLALLPAGAACTLVGTRPSLAFGLLALAGLAGLAAVGLLRRSAPPDEETVPLQDRLTGLPTGAAFRDRLEEMLALSRRQGWQLGVMVIDLRHFHELNEAEGRGAGDLALRLIAGRLRASIRREDVVARLAADRFAVAQTALQSTAGALRLAERLAEAIATPLPLEHGSASVAADIGLAFAPDDGAEPGLLLTRAEEALAAARLEATPTIRCFAPGRQGGLRQRRQLERELREAVADGAFALHWQPQRRLADGRLLGFEALLRWPHPERGLVPPDAFIPLAEQTGLIVPLGAWVLRTACAEAARWPRGRHGALKVAVNLSPVQIRTEGLMASVAEAIALSGIAPGRLELEVTESLLIQEAQHAARVMEGLRGMGVSLALDDFGVGWSSLAYLRRYPFDQIKMDRAFLADLCDDARTQAVVAAVLALGRGLGMGVVAEGIETEAQAALLRGLGCEAGQGWLLGRPMPAEAVADLLREESAIRAA